MTRTATTEVALHPLLAERWSPRAFDMAHEVSAESVTALLEAARWAASAGNSQPWRFLAAHRGDRDFDALVDVLASGNQIWARHASVLILAAAEVVDDAGVARSHALYDTGQAVAGLVAQAVHEGLVTHQMGGFDAVRAAETFELPGSLAPVVVVAVGRHDPSVELPEPLAARETAPRTRRPLGELLIPVRRDLAA